MSARRADPAPRDAPAAEADEATVREALRAYVKLLRASKAVIAGIEPLLTAHNLTPTQVGVLEGLFHLGSMTQRELGRKVLTSAGNMTDVIDKLERRGLVRRLRQQADRRSVLVELTPEGEAMIRAFFPSHARDIARVMGALTVAEMAELGRLLRKLGLSAARQSQG